MNAIYTVYVPLEAQHPSYCFTYSLHSGLNYHLFNDEGNYTSHLYSFYINQHKILKSTFKVHFSPGPANGLILRAGQRGTHLLGCNV